MKKFLLLASFVCLANSSLAIVSEGSIVGLNNKKLDLITSMVGSYKLEQNNISSPCFSNMGSDFEEGTQVRLITVLKKENDELGKVGDVALKFEGFFPDAIGENNQAGAWLKLFDRPDFFDLVGENHAALTVFGIIQHKTLVDSEKSTVIHITNMIMPLVHSTSSIQILKYDADFKRITYQEVVEGYNALGFKESSKIQSTCSFVKTL